MKGDSSGDPVVGGGPDLLYGGDQSDHLMAGAADDMLNGGPAEDTCDGGLGLDSAAECEVLISIPPGPSPSYFRLRG